MHPPCVWWHTYCSKTVGNLVAADSAVHELSAFYRIPVLPTLQFASDRPVAVRPGLRGQCLQTLVGVCVRTDQRTATVDTGDVSLLARRFRAIADESQARVKL